MIQNAVKILAEILYPCYCLICHRKISWVGSQGAICSNCINAIALNTPPFCKKCGRARGTACARAICNDCSTTQFYFERAWAASVYKGIMREMIHTFKYNHKPGIEKYLSKLICNFVHHYHIPVTHCDYVIPIPLSYAKLREREFNQAQLLADTLAKHFGLPLLDDNLNRLRDTVSQTELDKQSRWRNIQGAFGLKSTAAIKEKTILLIDDVLTTGATASEAAHTLKNAGAKAVFVLTVAS